MPVSFSPLRYPGGKSQFYGNVVRFLDENKLSDITYCEPFAGGAGVAIRLLLEGRVSKIIINDADPAIYSFWYEVVHDTEWFVSQIEAVPVTMEEWKRQHRILLDSHSERRALGLATLFLNRTNRSGILLAGPIGGKEQTGDYKIGCRFNKKAIISRIRQIAFYRNRIVLENLDGEKFIRAYSGTENAFWFIDPPYYVKGSALYQNFFEHDDHVRLSKTIAECLSSSRWILTYDYCEQISTIYNWANSCLFTISYSVQDKRKERELLFWNNISINERMFENGNREILG